MWRTFGASVRGSSHEADGSACQDAFAFHILNEEVVVLAVADGAGSASRSEIGAKTAVDEAVAFCRGAFESQLLSDQWELVLNGAIDAAQVLVASTAAEHDCEPRDLATTLQVVLAAPAQLGYARIGDGCCVVGDDDRIVTVGPRPNSEYINETEFLTTEAAARLVMVERRSVASIAVFTDGLQPVAMHLAEWRPHEKFFRPVFAFAAKGPATVAADDALTKLLSGPGIDARTDDDRTLLLSVWTPWPRATSA